MAICVLVFSGCDTALSRRGCLLFSSEDLTLGWPALAAVGIQDVESGVASLSPVVFQPWHWSIGRLQKLHQAEAGFLFTPQV